MTMFGTGFATLQTPKGRSLGAVVTGRGFDGHHRCQSSLAGESLVFDLELVEIV